MAGIIKSGLVQDSAGSSLVAAFNFEDMSHKAERYLESVRQQATEILVQAKQRAADIEKQAQEQGRQAALREAEQGAQIQMERRLATLLPALDKAIQSICQAREAWLRHWEKTTVQLAIAIAKHVIRRELSQTPEISLEWLRQALELVTAEGQVTVHLHPRDWELLGERAQSLTQRVARLGKCEMVADPEIELGGCRVDTEFGGIDLQISTQLARIAEELS